SLKRSKSTRLLQSWRRKTPEFITPYRECTAIWDSTKRPQRSFRSAKCSSPKTRLRPPPFPGRRKTAERSWIGFPNWDGGRVCCWQRWPSSALSDLLHCLARQREIIHRTFLRTL